MKTFFKLLLLTLVATLSVQYGAAQTPMPKKQGTAQEVKVDPEKQAEYEKARLAAETGQALDIRVPMAPKPGNTTPKLNAPKNANRSTKTKTVYDGSSTSGYAPVYGYYFDYGTTTQMIYPADALTAENGLQSGDVITALKFYSTSTISSYIGSATVTVQVGNTEDGEVGQSLTAIEENREDETVVFQGNLTINGNEMTVTFNQGYTYTGNNLLVDFQAAYGGTEATTSWYGNTAPSNSFVCVYGSSSRVAGATTSFLPKMTITYEHTDVPFLAELEGVGDFGVIQKGTSATSTITVTNQGTNAFTPKLTSSNAAFTVTGDMDTQLASGESRTFTLTFTAAQATTYTGTLTLSASESTDITGSINLSGEGTNTATVGDESATSGYLPVWGYNYNIQNTHHQMIYPATMLENVAGKRIKSITFYPSTSNGVRFYGGSLTVTMGTTSESSFASQNFLEIGGTTVSKVIVPTQGAQTMQIDFETPLKYTSGNLIIDTEVTEAGTWGTTNWYGVTTDNTQSYNYTPSSSYSSGNGLKSFLPKITFEFEEAITADKTELTFGDVAVGEASVAQTVTVGNSTSDNVNLSWTFSPENGPFSTTATANTVQADTEVEIPVTFTPTATGTLTGTLTINAGGETFTVQLSGNGVAAYATTLDPQTVDFGTVAVNGNATATVTLTNTGMYDITPTFTDPDAPFAVTGVEGKLENGENRTYTVSFAPTATGDYSGEFTINDYEGHSYTVTLTGVAAKLDTIKPNPVVLDFETVNKGATKDLTVTYTNPNSSAVAVALTATSGYTVSPASFNLAANGTQTVTVTFAPTAAQSYTGTLTATAAGLDTLVVLKGVGRVTGSPEAIRDEAFFDGITYTWPIVDSNGLEANSQTSKLSDIATDPDQIIAMLREVYTNKTIPGNYHRGYTSTGGTDHDEAVNYSAVGKLTTGSTALSAFADCYGWDIQPETGDILYNSSYGWYLNPNQYKPNDEGVTLLLLEMVDTFTPTSTGGDPEHDYTKLRDYFLKAIKSARVITQAKRVGDKADYSSGTIFKIDCDKMNKFFLIAKGQLDWLNERYLASSSSTSYTYSSFSYPYYRSSSGWLDYGLQSSYLDVEPAFLCHMFEQLSPSEENSEEQLEDGYQMFVTDMKSFGVVHDCPNVPYVLGKGHHFMMYGKESLAADCQDIRDMMLIVPDYRMMDWNYRGAKTGGNATSVSSDRTQDYFNYNDSHKPSIGVFVIKQNEIPEGSVISSNQQTMTGLYKHQLSWKSNLDDFLPGEEQEYELWEVVVDEFGMESYQPVYYRNANGQYTDAEGTVVSRPVPIVMDRVNLKEFTYSNVYVDMTAGSQTKTYVIRGRDKEGFLSLQMSDQQEIVIPGLDPNEKARMIGATYYSRYNPKNEKNCYSNRLELSNNGMQLTAADMSKPMYFYRSSRKAQVDENGDVITDANGNIQYVTEADKLLIATATATISGNTGTLNVVLANQGNASDYPKGVSSGSNAGYHSNTTTSFPFRIRNGVVNFTNGFQFWDNFTVEVAKNAHPLQYLYKMEMEGAGAAATFTLDAAACSDANSNEAWYAWTWPEGSDGDWVEGISQGDNKYKFTGVPVGNKIKFVRMNAGYEGELPAWAAKWNESAEYSVTGSTCTLGGYYTDDYNNSVMWGTWSGTVDATAYSNDVRVPVYKTDSRVNGSFTKEEVDADNGVQPSLEIPENVEFEAKVQLSSKSEILRYDAYRWSDTEIAQLASQNSGGVSIIDEVDGDDEEDVDPTGMAGNQGEWYTVSMNKVGEQYYYSAPVADQPGVSTDQPTNWANFVDKYPTQQTTANEYLYAPVVELFTKGYKQGTTTKRTDYNSYGGPQKSTPVGKFILEEPSYKMSNYSWPIDKTKPQYSYYEVYLQFSKAAVPAGYELYKVRAWRQAPTEYLGEETQAYEYRKGESIGDGMNSYLFDEITHGIDGKCTVVDGEIGNYVIGEKSVQLNQNDNNVHKYTFGARRVGTDASTTIAELPLKFIVRAYFTKAANLGTRAADDDKYYIVEQKVDYTITNEGIITEVSDLNVSKQVVGVNYVNTVGQMSSTPWQGVNIIVTRYSDGSTTTKKVIK